jgi:hypothetical protein
MIKLYLVEPKTGKRLKLGEDFGYFGDYIQLTLTPVGTMRLDQFVNVASRNSSTDHQASKWGTMATNCIVMRDAIDPLGDDRMFNGRTYGNGRFILCEGEA